MIQVRLHGRGGQGVVTAAELLSMAAFREGKYAIAFPSFGSERTGAPVAAFCRISEKEIRTREPVTHPDVVIIHDSTLLHHVDVFGGMSRKGYILINSTRPVHELGITEWCSTLPEHHICTIPASDMALKHLGRSLPNAGLVAAFAGMTRELSLNSVEMAIRQKFGGELGNFNVAVAKEAYSLVSSLFAGV